MVKDPLPDNARIAMIGLLIPGIIETLEEALEPGYTIFGGKKYYGQDSLRRIIDGVLRDIKTINELCHPT